jgi:hypothetical protein
MTMKISVLNLLILAVFASENGSEKERERSIEDTPILVKIEEEEYSKLHKKSKYIGVSYDKMTSKWRAQRRSKYQKKLFLYNGLHRDEETAAHASDTLARKLMGKGEQGHILNFPDDYTEVYPEKHKSSKYIGVSYYGNKWYVQRWSKNENKVVYNGVYENEKKAAHAKKLQIHRSELLRKQIKVVCPKMEQKCEQDCLQRMLRR